MLLTFGDALCTMAGIRLGVIAEGNPLLSTAVQQSPEITCAGVFAYTAVLLAVVARFGHRARSTVPLLAVLCAVKLAVMGLHLGWIIAL